MTKIRTCIFCKKKFQQEKMLRIFFINFPILFYNKKAIDLEKQEYIKEIKTIFKKKSRSFYICLECLFKENYRKSERIRQIKYALSKFKDNSIKINPEYLFSKIEELKTKIFI